MSPTMLKLMLLLLVQGGSLHLRLGKVVNLRGELMLLRAA